MRTFHAGCGQRSGEDVGDIEERRGQEDLLHTLVLTFDDDQPDDHAANRYGHVARKTEQFQAGGDADKFRDHVAEVGDQNSQHHQKGDAEAEFFADQVAQALAGDRAHAGAHLLHHDQGQRDRDHGPQQEKSVLRPGLGVGQDAAGIVVDVGRDDPRPDYGEEQQGPASPSVSGASCAHFADIGITTTRDRMHSVFRGAQSRSGPHQNTWGALAWDR